MSTGDVYKLINVLIDVLPTEERSSIMQRRPNDNERNTAALGEEATGITTGLNRITFAKIRQACTSFASFLHHYPCHPH